MMYIPSDGMFGDILTLMDLSKKDPSKVMPLFKVPGSRPLETFTLEGVIYSTLREIAAYTGFSESTISGRRSDEEFRYRKIFGENHKNKSVSPELMRAGGMSEDRIPKMSHQGIAIDEIVWALMCINRVNLMDGRGSVAITPVAIEILDKLEVIKPAIASPASILNSVMSRKGKFVEAQGIKIYSDCLREAARLGITTDALNADDAPIEFTGTMIAPMKTILELLSQCY
jgi:hypothetical protein